MNDYKIELGVKLDTSDLKTEINKLDGKHKVKLGVDLGVNDIRDRIKKYNTNSNNIKVKLKATLDTDDLKKQINQLNLGGTSGGKGVAIPVNTQSLETSLKEVKGIIADIKTSIGSLDSGTGMKSLLSSINQIGDALDKASGKFDGLNAELKILSSKDFSINVGINAGGSNPVARNAAYGSKVRNETLPQLKQQAESLEDYLKQYYKVADGFNAAQKLIQGTNVGNGKANLYDLLPKMLDSSGSLSSQMTAWKEYIALMKEAASIKGIDISGVTSQFSRQADELVQDAQNVQTGANVAKDAFKELRDVFGGSNIDADGLTTQLNSIVTDLGEIKTAIQGLSSGVSLDGLTQSFDKLSNSIELLVQNCTNIKTAINDSVGGLGGSVGQSNGSVKGLEQDLKQVESAADNASDAIKQMSDNGRADIGFENVENDLKEMSIAADNTSDVIQSMRNVMSGMKFTSSSIDAVTKDLEEMNIVIKEVSAKTKGDNFDITIKGINDVGEAIDVIKRFNAETGSFDVISTKISKPFDEGVEAAKRFKKEAETVKNIKFNIEFGNFDDDISKLKNNFNKLSYASNELRESVAQVENAYREMELAAGLNDDEVIDTQRLIKAQEDYARALERANNLIRIQARAEKDKADAQKLTDDIQVFQQKIDTWLTKNSAATKQFGAAMSKLRENAESCDRVTLNHLEKQFKKLDSAADQAGLKVESFGDRIKSKFKEYSAYLSVAEVFMYISQAMKDMFEQVKLIDSAMTELKKVTDESDASYNQFLSNASSRAKEIGTTIDGLVSSTADFARLGYEFGEAQELAEVANIYAVVGDEIDSVETATESLISTMTAFGIEASNSMSIVDKFNIIGNNFAISSGGIGEALERSASSMAAANNTLDETIALITAANTVVQDADAVGRLMPT